LVGSAQSPVPVFHIVSGPYEAPSGTTTCKLVALAALTVPFTAPKYTRFEAFVVLKPEPVGVIVWPGEAFAGFMALIVGWAKTGV
jgi:hypothetical protein